MVTLKALETKCEASLCVYLVDEKGGEETPWGDAEGPSTAEGTFDW